MSEKKDEPNIYDRIRQKVKDEEAERQRAQEQRDQFLHRRPSPEMSELKRRFNR